MRLTRKQREEILTNWRIERRQIGMRKLVLRKQIREAQAEMDALDQRLAEIDHGEGLL